MDTGKGRFEMMESFEEAMEKQKQYPNHGGIFTVGEIVEIKGSKFRIKSIKLREMRLKLLKKP